MTIMRNKRTEWVKTTDGFLCYYVQKFASTETELVILVAEFGLFNLNITIDLIKFGRQILNLISFCQMT